MYLLSAVGWESKTVIACSQSKDLLEQEKDRLQIKMNKFRLLSDEYFNLPEPDIDNLTTDEEYDDFYKMKDDIIRRWAKSNDIDYEDLPFLEWNDKSTLTIEEIREIRNEVI